ncbi:MAG: hypothetical protein MJ252_06090, partial [archaeon]|nr:hypothetical protein [archaeon]
MKAVRRKTLTSDTAIKIGKGVSLRMKGILYKKGTNLFAGWQKRMFYLLSNKALVYSDKSGEDEEKNFISGCISMNKAQAIVDVNDLEFSIKTPNRNFELKAETKESKEEWMAVLSEAIHQIIINEETQWDVRDTKEKDYKIKLLDKTIIDHIKAAELPMSDDDIIDKEQIKERKIDSLLNLKNGETYVRTLHGVLFKKGDKRMYNKVWAFLYSHRSLRTEYLELEERNATKTKDWIKFDTLFIFEVGLLGKLRNEELTIDLATVHEISINDDGDTFYLDIDIGERKVKFYSEYKGERDLWYEALRNSWTTAREFQNSVTKNPRNMLGLEKIFKQDKKEFEKIINDEIKEKIGSNDDIKEYNILNFTLINLEDYMESGLDGIVCHSPFNQEMLTSFGEIISKKYLELVGTFWTQQYNTLESKEYLDLALKLLEVNKKLNTSFRLHDENFTQNAGQLINIYMKKANKNSLDMVENLLKNEREQKSQIDDNNKFKTDGPKELFEILLTNFAAISDTKSPEIYIQGLKLFNALILQYLIGEDCVFSNKDIVVENEFYIAIANNTFTFNRYLMQFLDMIIDEKVLEEKDVNEGIRLSQITQALGMMNCNLIYKYVEKCSDNVSEYYQGVNYFDLDLNKILTDTKGNYSEFQDAMLPMTKSKCWEEIINLTLFYYIRTFLSTAYERKKPVNELIDKLYRDKDVLSDFFKKETGGTLVESGLKIIEDICDFLGTSSAMLPSMALTLRENIGPAFTLSMAKVLILLKNDLTLEEQKSTVAQFREILENFVDTKKVECRSFFEKMNSNLEANKELYKSTNELDDGEENIEGEKEKEEDEGTCYNLQNFLEDLEEDDDEEEGETSSTHEEEDIASTIKVEERKEEEKNISDVVIEGYLYKRTYEFFQKRYFQLKGHCLYWFKNEQSPNIQNKILVSHMVKVQVLEEQNQFIFICDERKKKKSEDNKG